MTGPSLTDVEGIALAELTRSMRERWPLAKLKLFGSKVKAGGDPESDIDLLILLPCEVTQEVRRNIVHQVFDINLTYDTNISAVILSEEDWSDSVIRFLPFHESVEREGITL